MHMLPYHKKPVLPRHRPSDKSIVGFKTTRVKRAAVHAWHGTGVPWTAEICIPNKWSCVFPLGWLLLENSLCSAMGAWPVMDAVSGDTRIPYPQFMRSCHACGWQTGDTGVPTRAGAPIRRRRLLRRTITLAASMPAGASLCLKS